MTGVDSQWSVASKGVFYFALCVMTAVVCRWLQEIASKELFSVRMREGHLSGLIYLR